MTLEAAEAAVKAGKFTPEAVRRVVEAHGTDGFPGISPELRDRLGRAYVALHRGLTGRATSGPARAQTVRSSVEGLGRSPRARLAERLLWATYDPVPDRLGALIRALVTDGQAAALHRMVKAEAGPSGQTKGTPPDVPLGEETALYLAWCWYCLWDFERAREALDVLLGHPDRRLQPVAGLLENLVRAGEVLVGRPADETFTPRSLAQALDDSTRGSVGRELPELAAAACAAGAKLLLQEGDVRQAELGFQRALQLSPATPNLDAALGSLRLSARLGAEASLQRAANLGADLVRHHPREPVVHLALAHVHARLLERGPAQRRLDRLRICRLSGDGRRLAEAAASAITAWSDADLGAARNIISESASVATDAWRAAEAGGPFLAHWDHATGVLLNYAVRLALAAGDSGLTNHAFEAMGSLPVHCRPPDTRMLTAAWHVWNARGEDAQQELRRVSVDDPENELAAACLERLAAEPEHGQPVPGAGLPGTGWSEPDCLRHLPSCETRAAYEQPRAGGRRVVFLIRVDARRRQQVAECAARCVPDRWLSEELKGDSSARSETQRGPNR